MSAWPGKLMQSCRCCWVSHCLLMVLSHHRSPAANNNLSRISAGNDTFFISHWCAADETLMEMIKLMIFLLHWEDLCTRGPRCWCGHLTDTDQPIAQFPVNISEIDLQVHPLQALFPAQWDNHSRAGSFSLLQAKDDLTALLWEMVVVVQCSDVCFLHGVGTCYL